MLSLGCILISDLVVTNLLMYSLPGMILLYLAAPFFILKVFLDEYGIQFNSNMTLAQVSLADGCGRLKSLIMMTSLQNIVILGAQGLLMLMGSKLLVKISYQATKHCSFVFMFCSLVIFKLKKIDPIASRGLGHPK